MRRIILNFILIINSICSILYTANLFFRLPKFEELVQLIVSILSIISVVYIMKKKNLKMSYYYLSFIYFFQSFTLVFMNFAWKLLIGPDLSLYVFRESDLYSKLDFKIFNLQFHFSTLDNGENWIVGINFVHLIIFFYLIKNLRVIDHNNNVV